MSGVKSVVRGVGHYLPKNVVTNHDLEKKVDTTHEWIVQRTGIEQRHIAGEDEQTSDLALGAAKNALAAAGMDASEIDLIVLATTTPDRTFPATAALVQEKLGITQGSAFDIQAVCSGFVYAVATADSYMKNGLGTKALVIGAETFSRLLDWEDRTTCVLFGDGAGAMVLEAVPDDTEGDRGVLSNCLRSNGEHWEKLYVDGGPSLTQSVGFVRMEGKEVFRHAVGMISDVVEGAFEKANIEPSELDWFVPHQANKRIIDGAGKKLKIPADKVIVTVDKHANTSAASVPMALSIGVADGRIKQGDLVMLEAMGGGFTWGASLVRW
ncbi:beta-ketoacyl-ACP synthase III [Maritalea porphyrae]|uniref:Beta-ketoacyl-[acyl-carrier-protein] synthase III n=1 Tax=Maritalea porphyrae TaxID=880732 RepID=A0ABQ5UUZ0_9HYPH|nr:beta-ketoacyl-ACP synthase III [Maritalea porphyrae]GLQ18231.1 3-oxoacyl-[acyl-carrier-protein] synthase 3 [Maritalea porphyrae]